MSKDSSNILEEKDVTLEDTNSTIDIVKILMAVLIVGIHTEPLGFNIWLDRGFGIITRLCVPFFFVVSSYFFWIKPKKITSYIKRILVLYFIWSFIYLPFDIHVLKTMSIKEILQRYLWIGNEHALWYLCASIVGFLIVFVLLKLMNKKMVFIISIMFLIIGCIKSTWAPLTNSFFKFEIYDYLGSRNGLFYAFPYIALGMVIAKNVSIRKNEKIIKFVLGMFLSMILLAIESFLFVLYFGTTSTILWISVLPCTYYLFMIVKNINIQMSRSTALFIRKISTLIYLNHGLFLILFKNLYTYKLFFAVLLFSSLLSIGIIKLSEKKNFAWMKLLY